MSFSAATIALLLVGTPVGQAGVLPYETHGMATELSDASMGQSPSVPVTSAPVTPVPSLPPCPPSEALPTAALPPASPPSPPAEPGQGTIIVTARPESMPGDPMAELNAQSYEVVQEVDEQLVGPVAMAYKDAIPKPVRHGIRNFLRNLTEPIVALNFLLQLKPGKAAETIGRFAINTTIGVGGLFDVAKRDPINLPYRRNGFANTLGYYGVEPGAYLFLPLIGPTTVRDLVGGTIDGLLLPTAIGNPFNNIAFTLPAATLSALQGRIQIDEQLNALRNQSNDPYIAARDFYLRRRQAEIDALRGIVPYPDAERPLLAPVPGANSVAPALPYDSPAIRPAPAIRCNPVIQP